MQNLDEFGICIKDQEKKVIFQNEKCIQCCGNKSGQVCNLGCMQNYNNDLPSTFKDGMTLLKNLKNNLGTSDTLLINDGQKITTIIYQKNNIQNNLDHDLKEIENYNLTKSEKAIFELILEGKTKNEICKILFISMPTLKSHINNIYKKIPAKWHDLKKRNST